MLRRPYSKLAALFSAGALAALLTGAPALANDNKSNLGPVGPYEPILASFGDKRVIAYFEPDAGMCDVSAVMFDTSETGGGQASTRVRVTLHPGELFQVNDVGDDRVILTCGPNAKMLMVLNRRDVLTRAANVN